jgi:membrane fusion protein (multidrug efflux system)
MARTEQILPAAASITADEPPVVAAAQRRVLNSSNLLVALLTVLATGWGAWWLYDRLTNVYILDARVASDMLLLSSRVPGWIIDLPVTESQTVTEGESLLRVDDRAAKARLGELKAGVDVLNSSISALISQIELQDNLTTSRIAAATAKLEAALSEQQATQGDLEIAEAEWQRVGPLHERNLLSQQEFEAGRNIFRSAQQATRRRGAEVSSARADLAEATAERAELDVLQANLQRLHSERTQAELRLEQASTELDYHTMLSPTDGVIDELFVDPGEFVASGQRVLVMHNPEKIWIKANVKETDLKHISVGGKVSITVDAYPDETRSGTVSRIGGAARSQFALLPNPNPSGNFTKSTQRIETTIELEKHDPRLKPGMMVEIKLPRR